ncbi:hypothetical protein Tsubulata_031501 [Turnera subulata]|uniref:Uncharacterized protein n=1 Tax=Turnera subulata TaxID=218843 RepID=A0A9Q0J3E7_9ROSI|nr:hypothetical protein Tsubulata_031501 [Turnera subulata]
MQAQDVSMANTFFVPWWSGPIDMRHEINCNWEEMVIKLHSVQAELAPPSNWRISRVPFTLRVVKPEAYTPQIISIGPLHHGEKNLQSMEFHKLHYMFSLLRRNPNAFDTLDACGTAIEGLDRQVRACYSESIKFTRHDLARILLVDACFVLELFLRFSQANLRLKDDPVFNTSWIISTLQRDLALLENQIPFFVLQWLFDVAVMKTDVAQEVSNLPELALAFFKSTLYRNQESVQQSISRSQFIHLLGLIHDSYLPPAQIQDRHAISTQPFVYSASSLSEVGIHFQKRHETKPIRSAIRTRSAQDPTTADPRINRLHLQEPHRFRADLPWKLTVCHLLLHIHGLPCEHGFGHRIA